MLFSFFKPLPKLYSNRILIVLMRKSIHCQSQNIRHCENRLLIPNFYLSNSFFPSSLRIQGVLLSTRPLSFFLLHKNYKIPLNGVYWEWLGFLIVQSKWLLKRNELIGLIFSPTLSLVITALIYLPNHWDLAVNIRVGLIGLICVSSFFSVITN